MNQPGTYNASLKKCIFGKTKNSGAMQFAMVFDVTHYQAGSDWVDIAPFERTVFLSMSGGAKEYTQKKLAHVGIGVDGPPEIVKTGDEQLVTLPEAVADQPVVLTCKHEEYNGSQQERWDMSWGGSGLSVAAADDEDIMKLNALWG